MIRISYECDETGQKMAATVGMTPDKDGGVEVSVTFDPELTAESRDPYGILMSILGAFKS